MDDILKDLIKQFIPFAQKHIGFNEPPRLFLRRDGENANNPLGKTAFYEPSKKSITLYITGRHPKDILRSLGHELVHHKQNCDGKFDNDMETGEGYAQENPHLRQMEIEANRDGSMCLRDFEDGLKKNNTIYYEHLQKGDKKMSLKNWKEKEIGTLLSEAWGFKFNSLQEFEEFDGSGELQAEAEEEVTEEGAEAEELEEAEDADAEELEEGFMDTMRKAGRSLGGGNFGRAAKELSAQLVAMEKALADGAGSGDLPTYDVLDKARSMSPELEAIAQKIEDYAGQNLRRNSGPEVRQDVAQMIDQLKAKVADYAAGKKMEENKAFAPNHYCVHHGGVSRNGSVEMAEAVSHNFNEELGKVTHYDMKFDDGTIMEGVPFEDIQVTNASLAEAHGAHAAKRDDKDEELEESPSHKREPHAKPGRRGTKPGGGRYNETKIREVLKKAIQIVNEKKAKKD